MQQNLYSFINSRAKARRMKVDDLARVCGFSRSTMYRYMNGVLEITPELAQRLGETLHLDEAEKQEFKRLIHLVGEPSVTRAREVLDAFFFQPKLEESSPPELPLICYQNSDRYLRSLDEILLTVLDNRDKPDFRCQIHISGCIEEPLWSGLRPVMERLLEQPNVQVIHLIELNEEEPLSSVQSLLHILPLLRRSQYQVRYAGTQDGSPSLPVPAQCMFIQASYAREGRLKHLSYFLHFRDKGLSPCLALRDENGVQFFAQCFENALDFFPQQLVRGNGNAFTSEFLAIQQTHDAYLIKPTFSYDDIPPSVYQSMLRRIQQGEAPADLGMIGQADSAAGGDPFEGVHTLLETLAQRYACSFARRHVAVHSCASLLKMAQTGRISDHLAFLPSFTPEELVEIFTVYRNRNADPKDSLTIHLVDGHLYDDGCCFGVYKRHSLFVQYGSDPQFSEDHWSYLTLHSEKIADFFADYVDKHVAYGKALSTAEATAFFDRLISVAKRSRP